MASVQNAILYNGKEKKTTKGINTVSIARMKHDLYRTFLFNKSIYCCKVKQIRSTNHDMYSTESTTISLSPYDDKRYIDICLGTICLHEFFPSSQSRDCF